MFFSDASISIRDLRKLSRGKVFCQTILLLIWEVKDPENNFKISTPNMASSSSNEFLKLLWKKLDSWDIDDNYLPFLPDLYLRYYFGCSTLPNNRPYVCLRQSPKFQHQGVKVVFHRGRTFRYFKFFWFALGIHRCNSTPDYLLKARLECETKESYVIMDKTYEIWLFWRPTIGSHFCITFKGVLVLLPEEWAKKRENKVELLVQCFFSFFSFNTLSRLVTCSLSK